uniref:SFRICE_028586 n=1 Tax=Spodoptera frugiperda TaxID=7108 RepID=A0A2H1VNN3_SPOFR
MLCYIAVDVFGFHQSYLLVRRKSLALVERTQLSYVFYMERCVLWMVFLQSIHRIQKLRIFFVQLLCSGIFITYLTRTVKNKALSKR